MTEQGTMQPATKALSTATKRDSMGSPPTLPLHSWLQRATTALIAFACSSGCSATASDSWSPPASDGTGGSQAMPNGSINSSAVGGATGGPILSLGVGGRSASAGDSACGSTCKPIVAYCGDGLINQSSEICDDGNAIGGDGCTAGCDQIEDGWACPTPGLSCMNTALCGDKKVTGRETCDDGNTASGDGCTGDCRLETGYVCPAMGSVCRTICGDGIRIGVEQCDDGNAASDDGCDAQCHLEPGYTCDDGGTCYETVCGNGLREATEQCDDTPEHEMDLPFDGCYRCMVEPDCAGGRCKSPCGDGQRFSNEACDDGNLFNGDGCSSDCRIEKGFTCSDAPTSAPNSTKLLPVVVRDFIGLGRQIDSASTNSSYHLDFNGHYGAGDPSVLSEVKTTLDSNGKPAWRWLPYKPSDITTSSTPDGNAIPSPLANCTCNESAAPSSWLSSSETWSGGWSGGPVTFSFIRPPCSCADGSPCTCDNPGHLYKDLGTTNSNRRQLSSPENLAQWFRAVDGVNLAVPYTLTLALSDTKTGTYSNINSAVATAFDPIPNQGWIAAGKETPSGCGTSGAQNVSFTTETRFWFEYQGGEQFAFSGDDDTWVFLNNTLVVDLGGLHGKEDGSFMLDAVDGSAVSVNCGYYYDGNAYTQTRGSNVPLGLVLGQVYEVAMFQAERNQCGSNFGLTLKNFSKPESVCKSICGDGVVAAAEYCDDGVNTSTYSGCGPGCVPAPYCGDGKVQPEHEQCDDGLNVSQYGGCAAGCRRGPYCGDGRVQSPWEDCDDGTNAGGYGKCSSNCHYDARCGDGIVQSPYEECDDGPNNGQWSCLQNCTRVTLI